MTDLAQTATTQPVAQPQAQPQQPSAQSLVDSMFPGLAPDAAAAPVAPASPQGPAPVSAVQQMNTTGFAPPNGQTEPAYSHVPTAQPATTNAPENPLPPGVRQRLAEEAERRRKSEFDLAQANERLARLEGAFVQSQQQQQRANQPAPPPMPDHVQDPEGFANWTARYAADQVGQYVAPEVQNLRQQNETLARQTHTMAQRMDRMTAMSELQATPQEMSAAVAAARQAGVAKDVEFRPDAWTQVVKWYRNARLQQETGGNIDAYKQRVIAEYLSQNPQAQAAHQMAMQRPAATIAPPSLAGLPRNGAFETMPADPMDDLRQMDRQLKAQRMQRGNPQYVRPFTG